jgi:SAM-dependent methyltransferase
MRAVRGRRAAAALRLPLWISLGNTRPLSGNFGYDRGTPIDRYYLDEFVRENNIDVHGDVLEVKSSGYADRFGSGVTNMHVLDVDTGNDRATVVADLGEPGSLPAAAYDCFLLMQTLQYVTRPEIALANAWQALRPGGVLLLTVPTAQMIETWLPDLWRFTPAGVAKLVKHACAGAEAEVRGYGNALACSAFLLGLAAQELRRDHLREHDPAFPVVACARLRKPS